MKTIKVNISFVIMILLVNQVVLGQRVLVISGGGARGAWGGGVAENLVKTKNNGYDVIIGTSTGSLMAPLMAIEDFDLLKTMYTWVKQSSIFNVNPFKIKRDSTNKVTKIELKYLSAIFRTIIGKRTNTRLVLHQTIT